MAGRSRRRAHRLVTLVAGLAIVGGLTVTGLGLSGAGSPSAIIAPSSGHSVTSDSSPASPSINTSASSSSSSSTGPTGRQADGTGRATSPAAAPGRVRPGDARLITIDALGVRAPVVKVSADGGVLWPPSDPQVIGWWDGGARPGADRGSTVLVGHTVHTGGGAFDHLDRLKRGERVTVRTTSADVSYRVVSVTRYTKASLTEHRAEVFDQSGPGRLVLITCDDWDGTSYLTNAVVVAVPIR